MANSAKNDAAYVLRLKYLKDAAHVLNVNSPSTAAHLLTDHNRILHADSRSLTFSQHRVICAACGSIRMPEWPKELLAAGPHNQKRRKNTDNGATRTASMTKGHDEETEERPAFREYKCMRCHHTKLIPEMRPPKSLDERLSAHPLPVQAQASSTRLQKHPNTGISKSAENASSKKRAKTRKDKGLLAALSAGKNQQPSNSSQSFDLFDFMR